MPKKIVELWQWESPILIVPMESGVIWTNQVGGSACGHPEIEGIALPLKDVGYCNDPLENDSDYEYRCADVTQLLVNMDLWEALVPDPEAKLMHEAWVPVLVNVRADRWYFMHLKPFNGMRAILTYPNSD